MEKLDHLSLLCRDPEVTAKFYIRYLHFRKISKPSQAGAKIWLEGDGGIRLHLFQAPSDYPFPPEQDKHRFDPDMPHLGFKTDDEIDTLDEFIIPKCREDHIAFLGNCFQQDPNKEIWHQQVFLKDPDGIMIEIFTLADPCASLERRSSIKQMNGEIEFKIQPERCSGVDIRYK
eukprot:Gb_18731 [translate_table: standard]